MKAYLLTGILVLIFSCSCRGVIDAVEQDKVVHEADRAKNAVVAEILKMMDENLQKKEDAREMAASLCELYIHLHNSWDIKVLTSM